MGIHRRTAHRTRIPHPRWYVLTPHEHLTSVNKCPLARHPGMIQAITNRQVGLK